MEVSGVRLRHLPSLSDAGFRSVSDSRAREAFPSSSLAFSTRQRRGSCSLGVSRGCEASAGFAVSSAFPDDGHMRNYGSPICGGKKEKKEESKAIKKKLKLLKGLKKDLSAFSGIGFGLEEDAGMVGEVKGKLIAEAAEVLMSQLKQLRAQEKEMKKKRKAEKAARMKTTMDDTDTSSSESCNTDCGAVVDMSRLRSEAHVDPRVSEGEAASESLVESSLREAENIPLKTKVDQLEAMLRNDLPAEESHVDQFLKGGVLAEAKIDHSLASPDQASASISKLPSAQSPECGPCCGNKVMVESSSDRIEVCMGGKCKKSGAPLLLEEFEKKVGATVEVVGCKCMGKCRNGPNVRVMNHNNGQEEDSVKLPAANPLCLGVSLEDVDIILANFFGQQMDMGLVAV
ncbi:diacylglycerol O-acyltransferase 3-like [Aristolochia californica]|uniref:diacylglycerol O-acyltransferase 3-like n=1 Tax=Aristolochia californica TaxID=171875 RepID=UPI0035E0D233